jgi:hypothetical protein
VYVRMPYITGFQKIQSRLTLLSASLSILF